MNKTYIAPKAESKEIVAIGILSASDTDPLNLPGTIFDNPILP